MPDRNGPVHGLVHLHAGARTDGAHAADDVSRSRAARHRPVQRRRIRPDAGLRRAGVDREVLGKRAARESPAFVIDARRSTGTWSLAGRKHPRPDARLDPRGTSATGLRVRRRCRSVIFASSKCIRQPPWRGRFGTKGCRLPTGARVAAGSRARVKHHEFDAFRLRVALEIASPRRRLAAVERALNSLEALSQGLAARAGSADADWVVRVEANRVILAPADRRADVDTPTAVASGPHAKRFDVGALDDKELASSLADRLRRLARAANLARLSSYVDPEAALQVQVLRVRHRRRDREAASRGRRRASCQGWRTSAVRREKHRHRAA